MSYFLNNLIARSIGAPDALRPRRRSIYEQSELTAVGWPAATSDDMRPVEETDSVAPEVIYKRGAKPPSRDAEPNLAQSATREMADVRQARTSTPESRVPDPVEAEEPVRPDPKPSSRRAGAKARSSLAEEPQRGIALESDDPVLPKLETRIPLNSSVRALPVKEIEQSHKPGSLGREATAASTGQAPPGRSLDSKPEQGDTETNLTVRSLRTSISSLNVESSGSVHPHDQSPISPRFRGPDQPARFGRREPDHITVTIGRIEVRAASPQTLPVVSRPSPNRPTISLDDYLKDRNRVGS